MARWPSREKAADWTDILRIAVGLIFDFIDYMNHLMMLQRMFWAKLLA